VRKNLENLYAKVEKHLGRDSPLLQVVWHDMQADFLNQLKNYQAIIGRCYPNSRINLEFTIEDVLGKFFLFIFKSFLLRPLLTHCSTTLKRVYIL
jgi:hypothetical protein